MNSAELDALGRRIERLTVAPGDISMPFTRFFAPILFRIGWRPKSSIDAVQLLLTRMRGQVLDDDGDELPSAESLLERAMDELDDNVRSIERATIVNKRVLTAQSGWLRRLYEVLVHAERALEGRAGNQPGDAPSGAPDPARLARVVDDALLAPPLALVGSRALEQSAKAEAAPNEQEDEQDDEMNSGDSANPPAAVPPDPTRVLELQLDTIDHLLDAARSEHRLFARKRRLLEAARQLLLETSAALELDSDGVESRLQSIARQVTRIDRIEALGVSGDVSLLHQARTAVARGQPDRLYATLQAIDSAALLSGDHEVAARTGQALERLRDAGTDGPAAAQTSLLRSAEEILGVDVVAGIRTGFTTARGGSDSDEDLAKKTTHSVDSWMFDLFRKHVAPGAENSALAAALAVDGCFDLGGAVIPVRVKEDVIRRTAVPFPTQELYLSPARTPQDLPNAVIGDPRSVLLDLAAGRLLARRYIRKTVEQRERTVLQGEVRVYVVDGSTSMLGARAYMRDAILVCELATLMKRMTHQAHTTRVVLFYRYFTSKLGPIVRIDNPEGALQAVHEIMANPQTGGTDIEKALIASMETVREARENDRDLARAQIVLITDGAARVSSEGVAEARARIGGDLPVGVSVIALGEENRALRKLVSQQRAAGERAFYHFIPDEFLHQIARGDVDGGAPVHMPRVPWLRVTGERPGDKSGASSEAQVATLLGERVGGLLEELADIERVRDRAALRDLDDETRTRRLSQLEEQPGTELMLRSDATPGPEDTESLADDEDIDEQNPLRGEGQRAAVEAVHRDRRALARRYQHWFPDSILDAVRPAHSQAMAVMPPEPGTIQHEDLESVLVVLATIAEVVELIEDSELSRQADAIELLERMLPDARLSPARWHAILATYPVQVGGLLQAVHASVRWGAFWRIEAPHIAHPAGDRGM